MKFLSGYNVKIIVQWGKFSARGGGLPLIPSVGKPWDGYSFGGGVYQEDFPAGKETTCS